MSDMSNLKPVELGFVDDCDPEMLHSVFFPSKVGGRPAWLAPNPPESTSVTCQTCSEPLSFLMQIYTGGTVPRDDAFHRSLFVFCCRNPCCYSKEGTMSPPVKAFRCQLPRANEFYRFDPIDEDAPGTALQEFDEKYKISNVFQENSFPELELFMDIEIMPDDASASNSEEMSKEQNMEVADINSPQEAQEIADLDAAARHKVDLQFNRFKDRIAIEPAQVLRYQKGGVPLWINSESPQDSSIPSCAVCGSKRTFEFQIMPQLLHHLEVEPVELNGKEVASDTIDWGVLAVYTCSNSCDIGKSYVNEIVYSNPVSEMAMDDDEESDSDSD